MRDEGRRTREDRRRMRDEGRRKRDEVLVKDSSIVHRPSSLVVKSLKFDRKGLIPAIIQDYKTEEVLMMAYMNKASLKKTLKSCKTCFWSRSRKKYWTKGETSGNFQFVKAIYYDCDMDALLVKVRQVGVVCHTGNRSCFYRKLKVR